MKHTITTPTDLHRYVSDQLSNIDETSYPTDIDTMIDITTTDLLDLLTENYGFELGQEIPDYKECIFQILDKALEERGYNETE